MSHFLKLCLTYFQDKNVSIFCLCFLELSRAFSTPQKWDIFVQTRCVELSQTKKVRQKCLRLQKLGQKVGHFCSIAFLKMESKMIIFCSSPAFKIRTWTRSWKTNKNNCLFFLLLSNSKNETFLSEPDALSFLKLKEQGKNVSFWRKIGLVCLCLRRHLTNGLKGYLCREFAYQIKA